MAEELAEAVHKRQVDSQPVESTGQEPDDIEGRFGAKLDRMLGGLLGNRSANE